MRRARYGTTLALVLALAPRVARTQTPPAPADRAALAQALSQGNDALDVHQGDRARALLEPVARGDDPGLAAQAQCLLGELGERELRFADALTAYRAALALDPGGRYSARATARIEWLAARGEGAFAPLATLERVRQDPGRASDPREIAQLAQASQTFPPGLVRAEARLLVGQAYAGRLGRPRDALTPLTDLAGDPSAPRDIRRLGADLLAQVYDALGEFGAGVDAVERYGADPTLRAHLREHARREKLRRASVVMALAFALAGASSFVRLARARRLGAFARAWWMPLPLAHIALFAVGGAVLAHTWDQHDMTPFFALGAGALGAYTVSIAWSVAGSVRPIARAGRALACAAGMLALSFLVMRYFDTGLLDGIGL